MSVRIYGNREIKTLPGAMTRPTSARVREALFNVWQGQVLGCRWLDLCAGSGAMGAEALCRGAAEVVGVEKSGAACEMIRQNWQKVAKPKQRFEVIKGDVVQMLERRLINAPLFDLVYFDPPYASELYDSVFMMLSACLSPQGEAAVEYSEAHWQPAHLPASLEVVKEKRYGSTRLAFLRRA
ncbi:MAG: 16S rRNA (guanine(966)-N(2))-methyltransferase RsmD [Phormidesmis sp.]